MIVAAHERARKFLRNLSKLFFLTLYVIIQTLVFIGELTQKILMLPFVTFMFVLRRIEQAVIWSVTHAIALSKKAKKTEQKEVVKETPVHTPVAVTDAPKKETKNSKRAFDFTYIQKFFSIISAFISKHKSAFTLLLPSALIVNTIKGISSVFTFPFTLLKKLLAKLVHLLEKVSFMKGIIHNTILSIRSFNRKWISIFSLPFGSSFKYFFFGFIFCLLLISFHQAYTFVTRLPSPENIGKVNFAQTSHLYDRNGKLLYELYRDENRRPIKLKDLPKYVYQASIAIEDKNFYNHHGIAIIGGVLRALKDTYQTKELQGGSTITQQLVKTALLTPERTITRKIKEMVLAIWTEQIYTKDQILEMYLNQVAYGGSSYGIEEASKTYFGKSAKDLSLSEAALLAGLPRAPSIYSPFVNPDLAMNRRNDVLFRMKESGFITEKQMNEAMNQKLSILSPKTTIRAPHFVFYTKTELEKEYGIKQVEEGGFTVTTTLDLDIQNEAEKILREELDKIKSLNVNNGGILVMNPQTGEIIAMVGSVDYFAPPYGAYNVTTASRQPGSTLKPALYALSMEKGYTAATGIDDSPVSYTISQTETYKPVNYDGKFHGRVSLRIALANSYNIPAIKVVNAVGVQQFVEYGRKLGIDTWTDSSRFGMSIALGGGEVSLLDLSQVYGVFASGGYRVEPTPVLKTLNSDGKVISELDPRKTKVMNEGIAYIISDVLSDNVARQQAFGAGSFLEVPGYKVAVKTGTTNDKKDNYTVGYTPQYLVAVWVGNNDNTPMNPYLTSGITGAAPIWNRVMLYLLQNKVTDKNNMWYQQPENVIAKPCYGRTEYFVKGTENGAYCFSQPTQAPQQGQPAQQQNKPGQQGQGQGRGQQQFQFPGR